MYQANRKLTYLTSIILFTAILISCKTTAPTEGLDLASTPMLMTSPSATSTSWVINDYQVSVNQDPFFAKGVSYSPVPWGSCSAFNPYGDFTINTWRSVWKRDLALMRANGVNLLKTYNTLDSIQLVEAGNPFTWDHNHEEFLKACWNNGTNPIYVLMGYAPPKNDAAIFLSANWNDAGNVAKRALVKTGLIDLAKSWGQYPAVMGFVMANEINSSDAINNSKFFTYWNDVADTLNKIALGKLVTLANVDDGMNTVNSGNQYMTASNFFWSYNSYRGNWTNSNGFDVLFSAYETATSGSKKPLMLTEWGAPASTHNASGNIVDMDSTQMANLVTYVKGHYKNMRDNRSDSSGSCIGGAYFEWSDELWKADPVGLECNQAGAAPSCHTGIWDPGPNDSIQSVFPGQYWDEEGFGLFAIQPVDTATRVPVNSGGCLGPWDPGTNSPYKPDDLSVRPHASALFSLFQQ
ncbi:hypothetical protein [Reichenbachiella sp.]